MAVYINLYQVLRVGDLSLNAWVEESEDGKECVDLVQRFLSQIDLR